MLELMMCLMEAMALKKNLVPTAAYKKKCPERKEI